MITETIRRPIAAPRFIEQRSRSFFLNREFVRLYRLEIMNNSDSSLALTFCYHSTRGLFQ